MEAIIDNLNLPVSKTWQNQILAEFEFERFEKDAAEWTKKANELVINDASQLKEMKLADDGRKILQKIRTSIEKKRKELKEKSLQEGKAIDAIAKALTSLVEPIERTLEEKAKYAENLEKARVQKLHDDRLNKILPYLEAIPVGVNYGALDNGTWTAILNHAKQEHEERQAAEEAARIAEEESRRKKELFTERRIALAPYQEYGFFDLHEDTTEEEFQAMLSEGKQEKAKEDAQREEKARIAAELAAEKQQELDRLHLQHQREKSLLAVDFDACLIDLASMTKDEFKALYEKHQKTYLEKVEKERKEAEERKRIEQEAAEVERQRLEVEIAEKNATDSEKLKKLISDLEKFPLPECSGPVGAKIVSDVDTLIKKIIVHIHSSMK